MLSWANVNISSAKPVSLGLSIATNGDCDKGLNGKLSISGQSQKTLFSVVSSDF